MGKQNRAPGGTQTDRQFDVHSTLSRLLEDWDLWYRIHVLLYDLSKVARDPHSEKRLALTLDPLYISEPYFSHAESTRILQTIIDDPTFYEAKSPPNASADDIALTEESTIEQAIYDKMTNFLNKRKASGDVRPCGPHDLVPIFAAIFGIPKDELEDERFLVRLRRSGLSGTSKKEDTARNGSGKKGKKGQKKG